MPHYIILYWAVIYLKSSYTNTHYNQGVTIISVTESHKGLIIVKSFLYINPSGGSMPAPKQRCLFKASYYKPASFQKEAMRTQVAL